MFNWTWPLREDSVAPWLPCGQRTAGTAWGKQVADVPNSLREEVAAMRVLVGAMSLSAILRAFSLVSSPTAGEISPEARIPNKLWR